MLITGESGTGKELVAAAIHAASARRDRPFVRVNCAAIPRDLVESEMFGHERGAFTGATDRRIGRFELAHRGTLFLDEVGDLGAEAQAKLLRAIEAKEIERVGGGKPIRVDVRIVAATNKDLARRVAEGSVPRGSATFGSTSFRFRCRRCASGRATFPRSCGTSRRCTACAPASRRRRGRDERAASCCARYRWPGNVRELANIVERLAILHAGRDVTATDVGAVLPIDRTTPTRRPLPARRDTEQAAQRHARRLRARRSSPRRCRRRAATWPRRRGDFAPIARISIAACGGCRSNGRAHDARAAVHVDRGGDARVRVARGACARAGEPHAAGCAGLAGERHHRDTTADSLSYDDAAEIAYLFNAVAALRNTGPTSIAAGDSVAGNVAVLWGPLTIAGKVHGSVIVVNGPVTIEPGGHVDKDLIVTGGTVAGADSTTVGGAVQVYRDALRFRQSGELIIAESPEGAEIPDANWFRHWLRRHVRQRHGFTLVGGPYNRVEGLPIIGGPSIRQNIGIGTLRLSALGIDRSADHFEWKGENLGWHASSELTLGGAHNVRFGIEGYDVVTPTESWQLRDGEVSLASFFLHRDYRDYYNTKGAHAWVGAHAGRKFSLELGVRRERWEPREARNPFTLFRNGSNWRPNPTLDDGRTGSARRSSVSIRATTSAIRRPVG